MQCRLCQQTLQRRFWSDSQWAQSDPTAHGLNFCKACDPSRVGVTMEEYVEAMDELEQWVQLFQDKDTQAYLSQFVGQWLRWAEDNPVAYYTLHKEGRVQLRPHADYTEDAGNKTYMLLMRLCFPRATAESHLRNASKLGNVVESLFGYAQRYGQLQHRFFCILTLVIRLLRQVSTLLPKTDVVQQSVFDWTSFEATARAGAEVYSARNWR